MKVLSLTYSKWFGIRESAVPEHMLFMPLNPKFLNHLGTIHASATYSLAETASGYFLQKNFKDIADQTIPLLRASTIRYRRAGVGDLFASVKLKGGNLKEIRDILILKRKVSITMEVKVTDEHNQVILTGIFEWFVTLK